jgi:hypothetical protein
MKNIIIDLEFNTLPKYNISSEICCVLLHNVDNNKTIIKSFKTNNPICIGAKYCMGFSNINDNADSLFSKDEFISLLQAIDVEYKENDEETIYYGFGIKTDEMVLRRYGIFFKYYGDMQDDCRRLDSLELNMCIHGSSLEVVYTLITNKQLQCTHGTDSELSALLVIYNYIEENRDGLNSFLSYFPFGDMAGMPLQKYVVDERRRADGYRYNNNDILSTSLDEYIYREDYGDDYYVDDYYDDDDDVYDDDDF